MNRAGIAKVVMLAIWTMFFIFPASAEAQQQGKIHKIGWLSTRSCFVTIGRELLRRELTALGYVEGKNFSLETRNADDRRDLLPSLADELIRLNVDVLIAPTTLESLVAKKATRTIPIVFINAGDPVAAGLVESLARPGGNVTGITPIAPVIVGKRLDTSRAAD